MRRLDKLYLVLLILLGALVFFPLALPSSFSMKTEQDPRFAAIPLAIGGWKGTDEVIDERTYEILETKNVLSRSYQTSKGERVNLLLVGSSEDRRVAHPPEVCYLSSNYSILNENEEVINVSGHALPVKKFVAKDEKNPAHQEEVLYIYKSGKRFTTNYYAHQLQFAWDRLRRQDTNILLIRLSGSHPDSLRQFFSDFFPYFSAF